MKRTAPILLSVLALLFSSLACEALSTETTLENLRMAYDENGQQVTSTFSAADAFYAVAELKSAPQDTVVTARWTAVDVADTEAELEFKAQTIDVTEEKPSGTIYFQLANDDGWPAGRYRVDVYLNDTLAQSLEFRVE